MIYHKLAGNARKKALLQLGNTGNKIVRFLAIIR